MGRGVLKNVDPTFTRDQVKGELRRYLGEEDNRAAAWRRLKHYKAGEKSLGETAADLLGHARAAATEEDVQQRLAVDAFLEAIPWKVAREVKKKKLDTLKKALEEAKFLAVLEEEENKKKKLEINVNTEDKGIHHTSEQKKESNNRRTEQRPPQYVDRQAVIGAGRKDTLHGIAPFKKGGETQNVTHAVEKGISPGIVP